MEELQEPPKKMVMHSWVSLLARLPFMEWILKPARFSHPHTETEK